MKVTLQGECQEAFLYFSKELCCQKNLLESTLIPLFFLPYHILPVPLTSASWDHLPNKLPARKP